MPKLTGIRLQDWRRHRALTLELADVTFVLAPNRGGKTSVVAALEYALTGRCAFTDEAGRGADVLIRHGAKRAAVEVDVLEPGENGAPDVVRTVRREIPSKLSVTGFEGSVTAQQEALTRWLGAPPGLVAAALNVTRFLQLSPDKQRDLLFAIACPELTPAQVEPHLVDWLVERDTPDDLLTVAQAIAAEILDEHAGAPDVLAAAHKAVYEARRDAKRDLQRLEAQQTDTLPALPAGVSLADKPRVVQQLDRLRKEREETLEQKGQIRQAEFRRAELQRQLKDWKSLVGEAQEALKIAPKPADVRAAEMALADAERARKAAREELHQADVTVARVRGELEGIERIVAGLGDPQGGHCPFAPGPFRCSITAAELAAQADAFRARCEGLKVQLAQALKEAEQARAALAAADQAHADAQAHLGQLQLAAERAEGLPDKIAEWKDRVEETAAEIQQLPGADALDQIDQVLQGLAERIARGEQILATLEAAERAEADADRLQAAITALRQRVEALEILVEAFSPAGIKAELLRRGLADIERLASGWLQQLLGEDLACTIQAEPFGIGIRQGEHVTPYHALSSSEQYRVGLVLQAVLSFKAGLGWLVLDGVDLLGPPDRTALVRLLQAFRSAFASIVVTATIGERAPAAPPWPGWATYVLTPDGLERLGAAA